MSSLSGSGSRPPRIVVIGGGATGTGIARDAAARGFQVTVVERGSLGSGTTGHFHGILHSGVRYAVKEPAVAVECFEENRRLRQLVPSAITDTGGMFVAFNAEEARHADTILHACAKAGISVSEISTQQALSAEPHLSHALIRAFLVPDAFINGMEVLLLNRTAALQADVPAQFMEHHTVEGFERNASTITAVAVKDTQTGALKHIECDYVINAAGVWSGRVAQLAATPFDMVFDKGTMIAFRHRFSRNVLNRCRPENDGDLLVPTGEYSVMGTTARIISDPDICLPTQEEVDALLRDGAEMVPQLLRAEVTKIYAGVRPLFSDGNGPAIDGQTRSMSRSFRVLDHQDQGIDNFISVVGGKVTLYRRMAEAAVDLLVAKCGVAQDDKVPSVPVSA